MPEDYVAYDDDTYGGLGDYFKLQQLYQEVEQEIEELRQHEYEAAENEAKYRMLVSTKTANERMHNTPVTVISDLIRGEEPIAMAKVLWKKAEADAKASQHYIFLKKAEMDRLAKVIEHEMYRPSNG